MTFLCLQNQTKANSNGNTSDYALYMDTFTKPETTDLKWSSYKDGGSGSSSPRSTVSLPSENITYSWSNVNVFTTSEQRQRMSVVEGVKHMIHRGSRLYQRKHILKNGEQEVCEVTNPLSHLVCGWVYFCHILGFSLSIF